MPPRIIEYIVAHELVHLCEPRHDDAFWQRLERVMPDYGTRKQWLAAHGGRFGLGEAPEVDTHSNTLPAL